MKIKIGDLTINQTIKICEKYHQGLCKGCPLNDERFCIASVHPFTTKVCKLNEREIELPDEVAKSASVSSTEAVRSLGDYDLCDQWVCPKCGIELQDYVEIERDEDDGEEIRHEYYPKFCPECGRRIIDPDEEVRDNDRV